LVLNGDEAKPILRDRVIMPCTHGKNHQEAIANGEDVIEMYLEAWREEGGAIPHPNKLMPA
jgi:predicted RNase H-like HicB family nuclease